jgi:hypothetical protein
MSNETVKLVPDPFGEDSPSRGMQLRWKWLQEVEGPRLGQEGRVGNNNSCETARWFRWGGAGGSGPEMKS